MKIAFDPKLVNSALSQLSRFATGKSDILQSVWGRTEGLQLFLQVTNMRTTITMSVPVMQVVGDGEFVAPLASLRAVLSKVDDPAIACSVTADRMIFATPSKSQYRIPVFPVSEFPRTSLPEPDECHPVNAAALAEVLTLAKAVTSAEVMTPGLRQVSVVPGKVLSGDGASFRSIDFSSNGKTNFRVPLAELSSLIKVLSSSQDTVLVGRSGESEYSVEASGVWVSAKEISEPFPDISGVFSATEISNVDLLEVSRTELQKALGKARAMGFDKIGFKLEHVSMDRMVITAHRDDGSFFETQVEALWEGGNLTAWLDLGRLQEVVNTTAADKVTMKCSDVSNSILISDGQHQTILNTLIGAQ